MSSHTSKSIAFAFRLIGSFSTITDPWGPIGQSSDTQKKCFLNKNLCNLIDILLQNYSRINISITAIFVVIFLFFNFYFAWQFYSKFIFPLVREWQFYST